MHSISVPTSAVKPSNIETVILPPRQARAKVRAAKTIYAETVFGLMKVSKREAFLVLPKRRKLCPHGIRLSILFGGESIAVSAV